jgi:dihydroorotase
MSSILIRSVTIADPKSPLNGKTTDLLIVKGKLEKAEKSISANADVELDASGAMASPGWIDAFAYCGEPGEEWKEDIASLAAAGAAGGFTSIAALCGSHPVPDTAAAIAAICRKGQDIPARILPIGTATKDRYGKELAEYFDMQKAGAIAFSDGDIPVKDSGLRSRIMDYAANCGVPFLDFPFDPSLAIQGTMHDGVESNSLGLKGIPSISEASKVAEAIQIATWLKVPLRLSCISSSDSVALIRQAKKDGLQVFASVPVMNLLLTDADLKEFDENCKVMPPLRTEADRKMLLKALEDGTIDAVCSNHMAQDSENKDVEFDYAAFGANNIQAVHGLLLQAFGGKLSPDMLVQKLHYGPAAFLGTEARSIEVGNTLDLTIFSNTGSWQWTNGNNQSKSKNSPFFGKEISGRILGTVSQGNWYAAASAASSAN